MSAEIVFSVAALFLDNGFINQRIFSDITEAFSEYPRMFSAMRSDVQQQAHHTAQHPNLDSADSA